MYGQEILFPDFASGCCLAESPSWPHENDILVHPNTKSNSFRTLRNIELTFQQRRF